jgi:peptide/nickel transport system substrate-binding protein
MRRSIRTVWHLFGIAAALLLAAAVTSPAFADKADNSVRFAFEQTPDSIDPYFSVVGVSAIIADSVWDTLIFRDPRTGEYKPSLATAWRWVDDTTLDLDLRQGVRFHNGEEFDAGDVVYTLNFVSRPENRAANQSLARWIDHAETLDKYKVRIVTKRPFPAAIAFLASPYHVIHPHEYYAKVGPKGMNERPVGSGPFRVVEYDRGKVLRLERNPGYFRDSPKDQPKLDKVEIRFIPDAQTRIAEMVAGGLDLIMYVARDQADQMRGVPSLQIVSGETMRISFLHMNTMPGTPAPQLRDVRVRQAIMHAIDRETMVKFLVGNGSRVLHSECYPSQFGCTDDIARYEYDPRRARQLLADAGYPNGFDINFHAYRDRNQIEAIIGYLGAVGIRARLRFMQASALVSLRRSGRVGVVSQTFDSLGIMDVANSVSFRHTFSSDDLNRDSEVRDLLERGDYSMDSNVRKDAYTKAFALIAERAYVLPLYTLPNYYLAAKDLVFNAYEDEKPRFWEIYYK